MKMKMAVIKVIYGTPQAHSVKALRLERQFYGQPSIIVVTGFGARLAGAGQGPGRDGRPLRQKGRGGEARRRETEASEGCGQLRVALALLRHPHPATHPPPRVPLPPTPPSTPVAPPPAPLYKDFIIFNQIAR